MKIKIRKIAGNILFYAALALILVCAVFLMLRGKSGEPTYFFGHSFLWVKTDSMHPTIEEKSYIQVRNAQVVTLAVGDVIVFTCQDETSPVYGSLITHRIVAETENGYRTKGDNVLASEDPWTVARGDVVAVYEKNLPVLTFFGRILSTKAGFALAIGIFLAVCGLVYLPSVIRGVREETEKEKKEAREKEIARLVAEEVARLEQNSGQPPQPPAQNMGDTDKK